MNTLNSITGDPGRTPSPRAGDVRHMHYDVGRAFPIRTLVRESVLRRFSDGALDPLSRVTSRIGWLQTSRNPEGPQAARKVNLWGEKRKPRLTYTNVQLSCRDDPFRAACPR